MDIYYDDNFIKNIPIKCVHRIEEKFAIINSYTSINQFRKASSCRKVASCNSIFKFRLSAGERIIFKYINEGILALSYATHDKQIRIAKKYDNNNHIVKNCVKWIKNSIFNAVNVNKPSDNHDTITKTFEQSYDYNNPYASIINEEEFDKRIDAEIIKLIKEGVLSDNLEEVREQYLDNGDIDKAIKFDEMIHTSDMAKFFEQHQNNTCYFDIHLNSNGEITEKNIKQAVDIIYNQMGVCMFPYFFVNVLGTGEYKSCRLDDINTRNMKNGKNKMIKILLSEIGEITSWHGLILMCLVYSKFDMQLQKNMCYNIFPEENIYIKESCSDIKQHILKRLGYTLDIDFSNAINGSRFTIGEKIIKTDKELHDSNMDFIFGK